MTKIDIEEKMDDVQDIINHMKMLLDKRIEIIERMDK